MARWAEDPTLTHSSSREMSKLQSKAGRLTYLKRQSVPLGDCCEMSRRDGAIVAWHEVPGTAPPQKSRPVEYGVIRAGLPTDPWQTLSRA